MGGVSHARAENSQHRRGCEYFGRFAAVTYLFAVRFPEVCAFVGEEKVESKGACREDGKEAWRDSK